MKEFGDKYQMSRPRRYLGGPETASSRVRGTAGEPDGRGRRGEDCVRRRSVRPTSRAVDPEPRDGEIHVWPLRDNLYLLAGDEGNIVVQVGDEGAFVVDTGSRTARRQDDRRDSTAQRQADSVHRQHQLPRRSTPAATSRCERPAADPSVRGSFFSLQFADAGVGATILSHQNVQNADGERRSGRPPAIPSDTFLEERRRTFHNGDAIEMFWEPNAVTDGDSIVHFRRADVIVTGDVFTTTQYPAIDIAERRHCAGRDQRAERHPQPDGVSARGRGRHDRRPRTRLLSATSTKSSSTATWS